MGKSEAGGRAPMTGGPGCQYLSNLREGEQLQKLMVLAISLDYD